MADYLMNLSGGKTSFLTKCSQDKRHVCRCQPCKPAHCVIKGKPAEISVLNDKLNSNANIRVICKKANREAFTEAEFPCREDFSKPFSLLHTVCLMFGHTADHAIWTSQFNIQKD